MEAVTADDPRVLVRRLHAEAMATHDLELLDRYFAPDFVSHNRPPELPPGVAGVKAFFQLFRDALPDVDVTVDQLVCEGEWVAVATTTRGTHTGAALLGVPPTGRRVGHRVRALERLELGRAVQLVHARRRLRGPACDEQRVHRGARRLVGPL